jgi:2-methylcitrate dehydratase PrpD
LAILLERLFRRKLIRHTKTVNFVQQARRLASAQQIEELAAFVAGTEWEEVPSSVQHHTRLVLLDTIGVILAGAERPEVRQLRERLGSGGGSGATVYASGGRQMIRAPPRC